MQAKFIEVMFICKEYHDQKKSMEKFYWDFVDH